MAADQDQTTMDMLRAELNKLSGQVENIVKTFEGKKSEVNSDILEKLTKEIEQLRAGASNRASQLYNAGQAGLEEVGDQVRQNPLLSLAIAFGAGCIISCMMRHLR